MKITVQGRCPTEGVSGEPITGRHVVVSADGVWLDGEPVIQRDRRIKKNRMPGHPWIEHMKPEEYWPIQTFHVTIDP